MSVSSIEDARRVKALNELVDAAERYAGAEWAWRTDDSGNSETEDRLMDRARDSEKLLLIAAKELYRVNYLESKPMSWSKPITDWQRETFGTPTVTVAFERAREEWAEMFDGFHEDWSPEEQAEEAADVVITLAAFVRALGFDLAEVLEKKMAKNRVRKWVTRGDGTGDHVKEGEES